MASSKKSRSAALALAGFLGVFGVHRFYVGKTGTALLMLCTFGGFGIWYLYDIVLIAAGEFTDINGRKLTRWDPSTAEYPDGSIPQEVLDELETLRHEVAELNERMDFAERLLASPREVGPRASRAASEE